MHWSVHRSVHWPVHRSMPVNVVRTRRIGPAERVVWAIHVRPTERVIWAIHVRPTEWVVWIAHTVSPGLVVRKQSHDIPPNSDSETISEGHCHLATMPF